jgi:hypothetical protein
MSTRISLEAEKYNDLVRCLTNLKEVSNDVSINNGIIRQRTNGNIAIFEIDISSIVSNINITMTDLKQKLELLKTFQGQDVDIEVEEATGTDHGYFIFSDQFSSIKILAPTPEFVDNKFMTEEELGSIFNFSEDDLLLEYDIPQLITDRVSTITQNFNVEVIKVVFEGETASLVTTTQAKDQIAKFVSGIETNSIINNHISNLSVIPFNIDHDTDVEFMMYKDPNHNNALNRFSTTLGEIAINIYSRSSIIEEE